MYLARELTGESLPAIGRHSAGATTPRSSTPGGAQPLASLPTTARARLWRSCARRSASRRREPPARARPLSLRDFPRSVHSAIHRLTRSRQRPCATIHMSTAPTNYFSFEEVRHEALLVLLRAVDPAADRHARGLDPQRRAGALRRDDLRAGRLHPGAARAPTWRSACASRSRPRSTRPGAAVLPARLLLDVARSLPAEQLTLELRSAEQDVELICGPSDLPPAHAARRGLPHAARAVARDARRAARRGLRRRPSPASPARPRATRRARCSPAS